MNWIIRKSDKLKYHTDLLELTKPLRPYLDDYTWVFCDLDFMTDNLSDLPINFDKDYFILTALDFKKVIDYNIQFIWGSLLAVHKEHEPYLDKKNLPYVEGNDDIWENGNLQLENADIEIDCFDSSYTIVKFKLPEMSKVFKNHFPEAIELEKFNSKCK